MTRYCRDNHAMNTASATIASSAMKRSDRARRAARFSSPTLVAEVLGGIYGMRFDTDQLLFVNAPPSNDVCALADARRALQIKPRKARNDDLSDFQLERRLFGLVLRRNFQLPNNADGIERLLDFSQWPSFRAFFCDASYGLPHVTRVHQIALPACPTLAARKGLGIEVAIPREFLNEARMRLLVNRVAVQLNARRAPRHLKTPIIQSVRTAPESNVALDML